MADTTITSEIPVVPRSIEPERLAWGVLLIAFAVFCIICALLTVGVHFFLFESTINMQVAMTVGRGTPIITESDLVEQAVRVPREIFNGTNIVSPSEAQSTILFIDPQQNRRLIATVTVFSDSILTLLDAQRPRFDWSIGQYSIDLGGFSGKLDVFVAEHLGREFRFTLRTESGAHIYLAGSGHYSIETTDSVVRVINRDGIAALVSPIEPQNGQSIPAGQQGLIYDSTAVTLAPAYVDLLRNSSFEETRDNPNIPAVWECNSSADEPPPGFFRSETVDERLVLRLIRADNAHSHGQTGCSQGFDPASSGVTVTQYDQLFLRANFQVNSQSLNICGIRGSECPLMLRMDYVDINGTPRNWFHGFYAYIDRSSTVPTRCESCALEHERVTMGTWYTYVSDNLFTSFPPDQRPAAILSVQFYASGHQYDVYVTELSLLAGNLPTAPQGTDAP
ncbi:MAG: hypothetical protein U0694_11630 [Anaerolineae bacterium]